ncbi:MAG: sugar transferase [Clostridiales bacterium]|nr:sugar transferase [Clostridiales bacterium]
MYRRFLKRLFDIVLSFLALLILSPLLLVVAVWVRIKLGGPVIFCQERPGKDEKIFKMYKFRSMTDARDENGELLPDEQRLTKFGASLRSTSLDELPDLWNFLKGDMSIVGPRPQLVRDMVFMTPLQRRRHLVRPGLTGLAQVRGRNAISWENKLSTDLEYIERITFLGDFKIIFLTVKKVFSREDITSDGMATATDFGDYLLEKGAVTREEYEQRQVESKALLHAAR